MTAQTINPRRSRPVGRGSARLGVLAVLAIAVAAIVGIIMYVVQVRRPLQQNQAMTQELTSRVIGLSDATPLKLAEGYVDADGDLVADAPADPAKQLDPPTLAFSFVAAPDADEYRARFKEFADHLSKQLGRPVEVLALTAPDEQLKALREGRLHVAAVNTGNIPLAVNQAGFVPVCGFGGGGSGGGAGGEKSSAYQMQIIVPADSPVQKIGDLKGRELTVTEPGSNSGFKAPLVLLKDHGLNPGRDFNLRYSGGHDESIAGIVDKTYQAAAIASDLLRRAMAAEPPRIAKNQFRVVYTSEDFPTVGFGYVHHLKPELATKVKAAFFNFDWKGSGLEKEFAASDQTKFVPVDYKNHFALVRRIDDAIRSIQAPSESSTGPTTDPATDPATTAPTTTTAAE